MSRTLTFNVFRHTPADPDSQPRMERYRLEESPGMTLFIALNLIRDEQDPGLAFDFVCRAGVCGSCAMVINGRPGLACRTLTESLPAEITLLPLPTFELIADLSVNTGQVDARHERAAGDLGPSRPGSQTSTGSRTPWTRTWPSTSTSSTAASSAAAA